MSSTERHAPPLPWDDPRIRAGFLRQLARRRGELVEGAVPIGWKVGLGSPGALERLEIGAPLPGYLTDRTELADGDEVDVAGWRKGLIEFEVAVWMGETLGSGTTPADARRAVRALGPAIEVADLDIEPAPGVVEEILAGNVFHRGVLLGDADGARAGIDLDGLEASVEVDGERLASTDDLQAITGRYEEVVATVANTLASFGEHLVAGAVVITGSVIPPVPLESGSTFVFALGDHPPLTLHRA